MRSFEIFRDIIATTKTGLEGIVDSGDADQQSKLAYECLKFMNSYAAELHQLVETVENKTPPAAV